MKTNSELAIRVKNLSKEFKLYSHPADMIVEALSGKQRYKSFWALKNISFDAPRGQVLGILGRNGAGKSTLLKIISGTLDKTAGEVEVNGRISSILELGTGFSGEYTGRENIYLGGLIVGLSKDEIKRKEDWIIEFSELGDFIDQPFRTYSTGMQARLTFATAVCVNPDILIIDEALSVGDARFQRKSFGKIEEFRKAGRTILLVSHDINTISTFCDEAIWLEQGCVYERGEPQLVSKLYYKKLFANDTIQQGTTEPQENVADTNERPIELMLNPTKMSHEKGRLWKIDLSGEGLQGDTLEHPQNSEFFLFENKKQLGPAHSSRDQIQRYGRGAYSHWGDQLLFSTSDNSDPRRNKRKYLLRKVSLARKQHENHKNRLHHDLREDALCRLNLNAPYTQDDSRLLRLGNGKAEILDYGILDGQGNKVAVLESGKSYALFFRAVYYENIKAASVGFLIRDLKGVELFGVSLQSLQIPVPSRKVGEVVEVKLHVNMWLANGTYFLTVNTADPNATENVQFDSLYDGYQFDVSRVPGLFYSSIVNLEPKLEISSID